MKGTYLINTDAYFTAPDGKTYKAVFGSVKILNAEQVLGIKTNAKSTNWYVQVGTEEDFVIIAGCQIHYAFKCDNVHRDRCSSWTVEEGKVAEYTTPSQIYVPGSKYKNE